MAALQLVQIELFQLDANASDAERAIPRPQVGDKVRIVGLTKLGGSRKGANGESQREPLEAVVKRHEFAPGKTVDVIEVPRAALPRFGYFKIRLDGDGKFKAAFKSWPRFARMEEDVQDAFGLPISYTVLRRLIFGGFIAANQPTPGVYLIDLDSLDAHLRATRVDVEGEKFWTKERIERYQLTRGATTL